MIQLTQYLLDATVYIVDDDASVRDALAWMLRTRRLSNESFDSAESFLAALPMHSKKYPSCLLLDVRMPYMSGLELFSELLTRGATLTMPVIFLTGHADVPTAVDAVKRGAFDFCEKPFSNNLLVDRIEAALRQSNQALQLVQVQTNIDKKLADLTEREQSVMRLVMDGLPNKLIADELSISVRTVEVHRARVFEKLGVKSAVELANLIRLKSK
jgi:two-component system response regulator DctR